MEETYRLHTKAVARNAFAISNLINDMDSEKAYVLGLLHDYGKVMNTDNSANVFHGIEGYNYFNKLGYNHCAKICLTHSFIVKDFNIEAYHPYPKTELLKCNYLLKDLEYDDYDKLIQLADHIDLATRYGGAGFESWFDWIKREYGLNEHLLDKKRKDAVALKAYFDNKCGCDVFNMITIKV